MNELNDSERDAYYERKAQAIIGFDGMRVPRLTGAKVWALEKADISVESYCKRYDYVLETIDEVESAGQTGASALDVYKKRRSEKALTSDELSVCQKMTPEQLQDPAFVEKSLLKETYRHLCTGRTEENTVSLWNDVKIAKVPKSYDDPGDTGSGQENVRFTRLETFDRNMIEHWGEDGARKWYQDNTIIREKKSYGKNRSKESHEIAGVKMSSDKTGEVELVHALSQTIVDYVKIDITDEGLDIRCPDDITLATVTKAVSRFKGVSHLPELGEVERVSGYRVLFKKSENTSEQG